MAGRGTDIVLGGSIASELKALAADDSLSEAERASRTAALKAEWQQRHDAVLAAGGLHIIGTERHESRRIDNQLRGRSGRQGDPGSSRFYLSLEDPLLRIFASERVSAIMERLKMPEGEAIEHTWVTRAIENAQRKVEGRNFDIRKQLLEYDDVANDQRKVIYQQRNDILDTPDVSDMVANMRQAALGALFDVYLPPGSIEEQWDAAGLEKALEAEYQLQAPLSEWMKAAPDAELDTLREQLIALGEAHYQAKVDLAGETTMRQFEHAVLLQHLDQHWREHLAALDHLRQGIHLRGYAQKNPKQEYKREAFELFSHMLDSIKRDVAQLLFTVRIQSAEEVAAMEAEEQRQRPMQFQHADFDAALAADVEALASASLPGDDNPFSPEALAAQGLRVGRNDPCPCGSGKKYKQCHGKLG
jgi:preprotein translocase subunit SecA